MIATQLALAVVHPAAGNLGGGGFMLARKADGSLFALEYREMAPAKAGRDMYLDPAGNAITDFLKMVIYLQGCREQWQVYLRSKICQTSI